MRVIMSMLFTRKMVVESEQSEQLDNSIRTAYDRHINLVYRICFSMMGNKPDAEDAAQSVFIKLMECGKSFVDVEHEKAWLIVTAQNHCRDLLRKWWRKKVVDLEISSMEQAATNANTVLTRDMEVELNKLPAKHRLVLYLHYYEGYRINEIAIMLKMNVNTVKTQMRKARKRLKLELGEDSNE